MLRKKSLGNPALEHDSQTLELDPKLDHVTDSYGSPWIQEKKDKFGFFFLDLQV